MESDRDATLMAAVERVEATLAALGYDTSAARLTPARGWAWRLTSGSAHIYVFVTGGAGKAGSFQVISPVMRPADEPEASHVHLYTRLLELNSSRISGAAFGLRDGDVVISAERSIAGLDPVEIEELIGNVCEYADFYDDVLTVEFGGTRCCDLEKEHVPLPTTLLEDK